MTAPERIGERVLILAPIGRDGRLIRATLMRAGILAEICTDIDELASKVTEGAGIGLLTEEALHGDAVKGLLHGLAEQPAWSDIPLLLLTGAGDTIAADSARLMDEFADSANITVLERPVRVGTLLSAVRSGLRARRRQYEVRDYIAERRRIDQDLRQTQKLESIGVLAGGVAHDFNNLLVGILGNASLAMDVLPMDSPAAPLLQDVVLAGHRAADLTRQLLAYSGKGHFIIKPLDLSDLVREISGLIQPSIPKMVRLKLDLRQDLPAIEGDSSQLQQLVMNLVINGAESIPAGESGTVIVATYTREVSEPIRTIPPTEVLPGSYACIDVRDSGSGMDAATLSRIFDPFFTTKFTGRGLGLAAALGIVRGHKGGIEVESGPGKGSTFRVYIPAKGGRAEQRRAAAVENLSGAGLVLVVDDEEMVRGAARSCLKRYGYHVVVAADGREGVELFRTRPDEIALVILDMNMPVMSGDEALGEMQKIRPDARIILSSGYTQVEATTRFGGRGLAGFLQKPYTASELAHEVKRVLEGRASTAT
jgi:signal transduction histidine kinase/ActR/RegA family two-component response regulator